MNKIKRPKKLSYKDHWIKKAGEYGTSRYFSMLRRKEARHYKTISKIRGYGDSRTRRGSDGSVQQVCSYQPMGSFNEVWCEYPCNGDC